METKTITINIKKEVLDKLRKMSNNKKEFLGKTISEATRKYIKEEEQEDARKRLLEKLEKGYHMGKILYKNREKLYDRY